MDCGKDAMSKKPQENNRIIGEKIYKLRRMNGLTQQELAELMGISITFLSEIENGHKSMSVDTLIRLSRALHASLDTIVFGEDPEDDMQRDVVSMMSALPFEYNESILLIAREMTRRYEAKKAEEASREASQPRRHFTNRKD